MRRRRLIASVTVGAVAIGALAFTQLPRDETVRTTVGDAVSRFRDDGAGGPTGAGFPAPGVYRYATSGGERLEALVTARHDYAGLSTVAVTASPCGVVERWQVFAARWSEERVCRTARGPGLVSLSEHREFFGSADAERYRCRGGPPRPLAELRRGEHWVTRCRSERGAIVDSSRVVGFAEIRVDNQVHTAVHVASRSRLTGESTGTALRDEWRRRSDGLLLRRLTFSEASFGFLGGGSYAEEQRLRLLSTLPRT